MYVEDISKEWIEEQGKKLLKKYDGVQDTESWWAGWFTAIKFAQRVEKAAGICEQCGKLITTFSDFTQDSEGTTFCAKCFDKVFSKEG